MPLVHLTPRTTPTRGRDQPHDSPADPLLSFSELAVVCGRTMQDSVYLLSRPIVVLIHVSIDPMIGPSIAIIDYGQKAAADRAEGKIVYPM